MIARRSLFLIVVASISSLFSQYTFGAPPVPYDREAICSGSVVELNCQGDCICVDPGASSTDSLLKHMLWGGASGQVHFQTDVTRLPGATMLRGSRSTAWVAGEAVKPIWMHQNMLGIHQAHGFESYASSDLSALISAFGVSKADPEDWSSVFESEPTF